MIEFGFQTVGDICWNKLGDSVGIVERNLLYESGTRKEVACAGHEENCFDFRAEIPVHLSHLKFVLKIRDRAEASNQGCRSFGGRKINHQALKTLDHDIIKFEVTPNQINPLLYGEERLFIRIRGDADDKVIKDSRSPMGDIEMAVGDGIKSAWVNCGGVHESEGLKSPDKNFTGLVNDFG